MSSKLTTTYQLFMTFLWSTREKILFHWIVQRWISFAIAERIGKDSRFTFSRKSSPNCIFFATIRLHPFQCISLMFSPFSLLHWHTSLDPQLKLRIRSPVDAFSHNRIASSDALIASGLQGDGLWLELRGTTLYSPFSGQFHRKNQTGQHLLFTHSSGLKLALDFPLYCQHKHGVGFHWLVSEQANVQAGQALLHYDKALLSQPRQSFGLFLRVVPHPKIQSIHCRTGYHQALQDDLLAIQLVSA